MSLWTDPTRLMIPLVTPFIGVRSGGPWTSQDTATLLRLSNEQGLSMQVVAAQLGRTIQDCSDKLWELNASHPFGPLVGSEAAVAAPKRRRRGVHAGDLDLSKIAPAVSLLEMGSWKTRDLLQLVALVRAQIEKDKGEGGPSAVHVPLRTWDVVASVMGCSTRRCLLVMQKFPQIDFTRKWTKAEEDLLQRIKEGRKNWQSLEMQQLMATRLPAVIATKL